MNRYESYRNTEIDWIGHLPKGWNLSRAKFLFRNKSKKNFPNEPLLSVTQKNGVVIRSELDMNVWNPTDDVSGYKLIEPGNFVISLRSFEGGIELSKIKGIVSPAYTVLEKQKEMEEHYLWWLMKSHQFIIELNKHVTGIRQGKNIGWDDFSNIYLTIPPLREQKFISRYLDKKTEQINSLIEKIQKKIELLKEQRISLINQCATKGLNPNVEMKDSGVEWIGPIPEGWSVIRCGSFLSEKSIKNTNGEVNLSVSRKYGVIPKNSRDNNHKRVSEDISNYKLVVPGDFVLNKMQGWSGSLGVSDYRGIVSPAYTVMEPVQEIHNSYFHYLLRSETYRQIYESLSYGVRVGQWELRYHDFKTILSLCPPLEEQKLISNYLDKKTGQIDSLIEKIQKKIKFLKEYRQSLISSVVTGKIRITENML